MGDPRGEDESILYASVPSISETEASEAEEERAGKSFSEAVCCDTGCCMERWSEKKRKSEKEA